MRREKNSGDGKQSRDEVAREDLQQDPGVDTKGVDTL